MSGFPCAAASPLLSSQIWMPALSAALSSCESVLWQAQHSGVVVHSCLLQLSFQEFPCQQVALRIRSARSSCLLTFSAAELSDGSTDRLRVYGKQTHVQAPG